MDMKLSRPQSIIYADTTRFRVCVAGRRFGKSYLSGSELINAAMGFDKITGEENRDKNVVYIAPTFQMCKGIMWKWLMENAPKGFIKKHNVSELYMEFYNGSSIQLRSGENYDSLRGLSLSFVVMDEVADLHPDCWSLVCRPALSDQEGGALFIGTPKGTNHFYTWYLDGIGDEKKNWSSHSYTTLDGGQVSNTEVEEARLDLSPTHFAQEYEASFTQLANRVYPDFTEANMASVKYDGGTVHIGLDFNVRQMSAVCANYNKFGLGIHTILNLTSTNTRQMAELILETFPGKEIILYADPAGRSRSTKAESGVTDHSILRDHGFRVIIPEKQLSVNDRVKTVNALIENAKGEKNLLVDHSCKALRDAFLLQQYDENGIPDKKTKDHIDDILDSAGYLVFGTHPIQQSYGFDHWDN